MWFGLNLHYIHRTVLVTSGVFLYPITGERSGIMEPKTIIGICLVVFIVVGLAFLFIRNRRK